MRVSPLDIRKQVFKKVMRGADQEEVRMFLDVVASEYEKVIQDNAMMAERIRTLDARVAEFRALEENMRNSLVMADRIATESRESADRESRRIVQDAHSRSERILEDARERLQILVREIETLRGKKEVFARRFWTMIEGQIGILQEHMADTVEVESLRQRVSQLAADARGAAEAAEQEVVSRPAGPARPMARPESPPAEPYRDDYERPAPPRRTEPERAQGTREEVVEFPVTGAARTTSNRGEDSPGPDLNAHAVEPIRPAASAARRVIPRGLGQLLRGRQSSLPLGEPSIPPEKHRTPEPAARAEELPESERAEGFYEMNASDPRRRESAPWPRGDDAGDRT